VAKRSGLASPDPIALAFALDQCARPKQSVSSDNFAQSGIKEMELE
jgi:hypothetical protein